MNTIPGVGVHGLNPGMSLFNMVQEAGAGFYLE